MLQNSNKQIISHSQEICLSSLINLEQNTHDVMHLVITIASHVSVTVIDDLHDRAFFTTKIEFILQEEAKLSYLMKALESFEKGLRPPQDDPARHLIEKEIMVHLVGRHASAEVTCVCFGFGKKVFKFKTLQDHQAEQTTSKVVVKSVLDDESTLFCHTLIHVNKQAQQTLAEQVNKNILLKNTARAVSVPTLEVLAHDVRCKHGAAVSKLDAEQMFYVQSRGIDKDATRQLLIQAFLS